MGAQIKMGLTEVGFRQRDQLQVAIAVREAQLQVHYSSQTTRRLDLYTVNGCKFIFC